VRAPSQVFAAAVDDVLPAAARLAAPLARAPLPRAGAAGGAAGTAGRAPLAAAAAGVLGAAGFEPPPPPRLVLSGHAASLTPY